MVLEMPSFITELLYFVLYLIIVAFVHIILPAAEVDGYACDETTKKPLRYRLNGVRIWIVAVCSFVAHVYISRPSKLITLLFTENIWDYALIANLCGLLLSLLAYTATKNALTSEQRNKRRSLTVDQIEVSKYQSIISGRANETVETDRGFIYYFYSGLEFNPRCAWMPLFDFKMYLYVYGAVSLQLIVLLAAHTQFILYDRITMAMSLYAAMMSYFVVDYLYHEDVHLYTYDMFAEKLGFKLIWGCLCFYPFFYSIGVWSLIHSDLPVPVLFTIFVFAVGHALSRGANSQKYYAKTRPQDKFLGIEQRFIPGTKLIYSGWWSLSRHVNYFGEILMGIALALPGLYTGSFISLLYPIYYIILLVARERTDNTICHEKYGKAWDEYCKKVPYRIIPFLY